MVVGNFQTFGKVMVGVLTSFATYFMFRNGGLNNNNLHESNDLEVYEHYAKQAIPKNHITNNAIPETILYPRQTGIIPMRVVDYEIDQILLISPLWLPNHQTHLSLMTELIEELWDRSMTDVRVTFIPSDSIISN